METTHLCAFCSRHKNLIEFLSFSTMKKSFLQRDTKTVPARSKSIKASTHIDMLTLNDKASHGIFLEQ